MRAKLVGVFRPVEQLPVANDREAKQKDSPQRHRGTEKKPGDDPSTEPIGGDSLAPILCASVSLW
jgi:hypothetical protein